jgi:holo-[acyl-carrier protein] synthase
MIVGLGTDLVEVARFRLALERRAALAERLFSDDERAYAFRQKDPSKSLAARFGAKEAVMKAMGVGLWKFRFRDVEVVRAKSGAPSISLTGRAGEMATERGITTWHLSLTHTETTAMAVAIAMSV